MALCVAFVYSQLSLLNPHPTKEASKEKMIQSSEGMIGQEIVYADSSIDFFQNWIMWIIPMEGF